MDKHFDIEVIIKGSFKVSALTEESFNQEVERSLQVLENLTGIKFDVESEEGSAELFLTE